MSGNKRIIAEYYNIVEAEMAKGRLESAGIPAIVLRDDAGGMEPQLQFASGVYLAVRASDRADAEAILAELGADGGTDESDEQ